MLYLPKLHAACFHRCASINENVSGLWKVFDIFLPDTLRFLVIYLFCFNFCRTSLAESALLNWRRGNMRRSSSARFKYPRGRDESTTYSNKILTAWQSPRRRRPCTEYGKPEIRATYLGTIPNCQYVSWLREYTFYISLCRLPYYWKACTSGGLRLRQRSDLIENPLLICLSSKSSLADFIWMHRHRDGPGDWNYDLAQKMAFAGVWPFSAHPTQTGEAQRDEQAVYGAGEINMAYCCTPRYEELNHLSGGSLLQ